MNANKMNLWKPFCDVMGEEVLYQSYFFREIWTLEQAACLMAGILPEKYSLFMNSNDTFLTYKDLNILKDVARIYKGLLDYIKTDCTPERIHIYEKEVYMSPHSFIRWLAIHGTSVKVRFLRSMSLPLMEVFIENQSLLSPLETKPRNSRQFHTAFYLKNALEIIRKSPQRLSNQEIYNLPRMQNVLRQIRSMGGNYSQRTIIKSWLPKLEKRTRGRPKKS